MKLTFDREAFQINGKDAFMVSGEFHYFRVPHTDWKRRMELFKEAGGNTLATYVPWIIHEPEEGDIRFGDCPQRDLAKFLDTAKEVGLGVVLRPGPYQYSELTNDGLPEWLLKNYPEVRATDPNGKAFRHCSVSYLHPTLLEKTHRYFKAFADVVRPYIGDPVTMLQVDNECAGIHLWFGGPDYNPTTMGFGQTNGRYPRFLEKTFGTVASMNEAYGTSFDAFTDVPTPANMNRKNPRDSRRLRDYYLFYFETLAEFLCTLRTWFEEDGLHVPVCHNAASPQMNSLFRDTVACMGDNFLLGCDHYYNLNQTWQQNNPTPQRLTECMVSLERLRLMGMPPSVLEMPGGSPSDTPPILREDLQAWYRAHIGFGMKGVNYYVYTGGPNFPGTGATSDIYDYNALIHADGTINPTYYAAKDAGELMAQNPWFQRAKRRTSVCVGIDHQPQASSYDYNDVAIGQAAARTFLERGVMHTLLTTRYAPELADLEGDLDLTKPLVVPSASVMARHIQENLLRFLQRGGKVLMLGAMPQLDEHYCPCTILQDWCGATELTAGTPSDRPVTMTNGRNVYQLNRIQTVKIPTDAHPIATEPLGFRKGNFIWLACTWNMALFSQSEMMEDLLAELGATPSVFSTNRNLIVSLLEGQKGEKMLFVINLFSGKLSTEIQVWEEGQMRNLGKFDLGPMETQYHRI